MKIDKPITLKHLIVISLIGVMINMMSNCSNDSAYIIKKQKGIIANLDSIHQTMESMDNRLNDVESNTNISDSLIYRLHFDVGYIKSKTNDIEQDMGDIKVIAAKKSSTSIILKDSRSKNDSL